MRDIFDRYVWVCVTTSVAAVADETRVAQSLENKYLYNYNLRRKAPCPIWTMNFIGYLGTMVRCKNSLVGAMEKKIQCVGKGRKKDARRLHLPPDEPRYLESSISTSDIRVFETSTEIGSRSRERQCRNIIVPSPMPCISSALIAPVPRV